MDLRIASVHKRFGSFAALHDVDLDIRSGELIALLGPSGSGKTTLLRAIAGLLPVDAGRILFGERDATDLSLRERRVGFVFQHFALFRHLSVFENIAFGLRSRQRRERPTASEITRRVEALLQRIQLPELGARYPDQLSGGQRQRVALARAMAIDPTVLLLDEPFGALDAKVRVHLRRWLRQIHDETGYTTLFVTHDQDEALELADRVVVLDGGRIQQVGTPEEVYRRPATPFVFDFIGRGGAIFGRVEAGRFMAKEEPLALPAQALADGPAQLLVRPHDLRLVDEGAGLRGRVRAVRSAAGRHTLEIELAQQDGVLELDLDPDRTPPARGTLVDVLPTDYRLFAAGRGPTASE